MVKKEKLSIFLPLLIIILIRAYILSYGGCGNANSLRVLCKSFQQSKKSLAQVGIPPPASNLFL